MKEFPSQFRVEPEPADADRVYGGDAPERDAPKPKDPMLVKAEAGFSDFHKRFEKTINGYFGTKDIAFTAKPGGWYIDFEKIEVNADPNFFLERGYTEPESLFATFHEARHFLDMIRDPETYTALFERIQSETAVHGAYPKALFRLHNCIDDVLVNNGVMASWDAGRRTKDSMYPKLFPSADLSHDQNGQSTPRHRQFMYALLRQAMLPDEPVVIDDDVREAIRQVNFRGEGKAEFLRILTAVDMEGNGVLDPRTRFAFIQQKIQPIFEELYKKDLLDRKEDEKKQKGEGEGKKGEGDGEEEPFGDDPLEDVVPDPIDFDDLLKNAKKINDRINENKKDKWEKAMGVNKEDADFYARDYKKVEKYIDDLSRLFDDVINRRKSVRRRLRKPVKEGVLLDSRKLATAYAEIRAGNTEPTVMLDYRKYEQIDNVPSEFEFTLVGDGSGSMNNRQIEQRRIAVLVVEALAAFRDRVQTARRQGEDIRLDVRTGVRIFSNDDISVKPLTDTLTNEERIAMHKAFRNLPLGENNEPKTFDAIKKEDFTSEKIAKLRKGDLKKVILFLTDGESDETKIQAKIRELYALVSDTSEQHSLIIAAIGFAEGKTAVTTYAPYGYYANDMSGVPEIFKQFLAEILDEL